MSLERLQTEEDVLEELFGRKYSHLESSCLNRSLITATRKNDHHNVSRLLTMGATNLGECLRIAKEEKKPRARAMLLLMKASQTGDETITQKLLTEDSSIDYEDDDFADVQDGILRGKVSAIVPFEIARRKGHSGVVGEFLKVNVNKKTKSLCWQKLKLEYLDALWLNEDFWLKNLRLSENEFLPEEMGAFLMQVVKVDLQENELSTIPGCLLNLPSLEYLNLSCNKLVNLPNVLEWSPCLTNLNLSHNQLSDLPESTIASCIKSLNLRHNQFSSVPVCICSLKTLQSLDLSENHAIVYLPFEMGRLQSSLTKLKLHDMKNLKNPPKKFRNDCGECLQYLYDKQNDYLHKICQNGDMESLISFIYSIPISELCDRLSSKRGSFDYTPLHLFVVKGESEVLDNLLSITFNSHINCEAKNGFTPLHLAVSIGHVECVKVLLAHGANLAITDKQKNTPKQIAVKFHKESMVHLLQSEELIKEVRSKNDMMITAMLEDTEFDLDTLNRAMVVATQIDNVHSVSKLALKGARNLEECLKIAKEWRKPCSRAMLLLIKAAQTGNKAIVQKVFGEITIGLVNPQDYSDDGFADVQNSVLNGKVSTAVPIEIARKNGQLAVREELLLRTDVNEEEGYVYWHGLQLRHLHISSLRKIHWVKKLRLENNGFRSLPPEMGTYLKQVVEINLQHNDLQTIPRCLLELPSLGKLNLSHNELVDIPEVPEWSACLTVLDLSYNQLSSIPCNAVALFLESLNLSNNKFCAVPICVCSFTTLHSLNLADNHEIKILPAEMGRLSFLTHLNLTNLKKLRDPPKNLQKDARSCIRYLYYKLHSAKCFYKIKLMIVGCANRGKTTLVARLQGKDCGYETTVGVEVSEWLFKPTLGRKQFHFCIWDFGGQEEYYATHQCFLSQHSLYLLLFNLTHGEKSLQELKPWLNSIALRAPRSCVIIIGTHLDEIEEDQRKEIDELLQKVGTLAGAYNNCGKLWVAEVMPVGLKNTIENVGLLKEAIYNHAANYKTRGGQPIMGQKIPASYHALDKQMETVLGDVRRGLREPIMHVEELKTMVEQMSLPDIQDDDELRTATLFLTDIGSLLHFDDRGHNLHELYFVDPCWLCEMMYKFVTTKERNPFFKKGLLHSKDIPLLFKDDRFPWQYFEQFLTLLDRFEIALPLDNRRVLIPSMLPEERPKDYPDDDPKKKEPVYTRFIMFSQGSPGFWSRLLSRVMHSVPEVRFALDKITPSYLEQETPTAINGIDTCTSIASPTTPASENELLLTMGADQLPEKDFNTGTIVEENVSNMPSLEYGSMPSSVPSSMENPSDVYETSSSNEGPAISPPLISGPPPYIPPQNMQNAPNILPESLPLKIEDSYNINEVQLEYWRTGLHYCDPNLMFRIESLSQSKKFHKENKEGVLIVASPNSKGKKIIGQLVDLAVTLVNEWYPGLQESSHSSSSSLEQKVPCFECVKEGRAKPFEFKVEQCLSVITRSETSIECGYFRDDPCKNHTIPLTDIVPDLVLQDINNEFLLQADDIIYQEDESSLLGKGGYGKVYRGKCKGKSVAIKKYLIRNEGAFSELRSEAKLLQQSHHPCLVCLVGVCVHPIMALVLEEAPLKSLELPILKKKIPVHRLTIFRIAAEVAAALRFLHSRSIIYCDMKAANVLLWTLDPSSLCHCKLADFSSSTYLAPVGAKGLKGTKGFIAPEVLHISKRKQRSVYDHKADIFSFGMFLYQLIARRHPYHDIPPHRIDVAVELKEQPKLHDIDVARTGYHYLTQLMKKCWEDNPKHRPDTSEIIKTVCLSAMQSVMCVAPIKSKLSMRQAISITPTDFTRAGAPQRLNSELWVVCDGSEGVEINMYNTNTMVKVNKNFIEDNQIQCITLCGDHVWVGSRAGIEYGVIDIFSITNRDLVHNIRMREISVSCITSTEKSVYLGTLVGYCFCFVSDIASIRANHKPKYKYISENAIDGIVATHLCVWISHTKYIYFLNFDNLSLEGSIHRDSERKAFVGQLSPSPDGNIIWSAHLGGTVLTAWDPHQKTHSYDVNTAEHLKKISPDTMEKDMIMSAMTPALDCVWVGMASGHIMVFHEQDLLTWYHPYKEHVRFLTCIPYSGPCEMEKSIVASGGKSSQPLIEGMSLNYERVDDRGVQVDKAGVVVMWEAYDSKTMRQIKLIEGHAPGHLDNHHTVRSMIQRGDFKDGTHISSRPSSTDSTPYTPDLDLGFSMNLSEPFAENLADSLTMGYMKYDSLRARTSNFFTHDSSAKIDVESMFDSDMEPEVPQIIRPRTRTATVVCDLFNIKLPSSGPDSPDQVVRVQCPKPVTLKVLLSELEVNAGIQENTYQLEYQVNKEEKVKINNQEDLDKYLLLTQKPELMLTWKSSHSSTSDLNDSATVTVATPYIPDLEAQPQQDRSETINLAIPENLKDDSLRARAFTQPLTEENINSLPQVHTYLSTVSSDTSASEPTSTESNESSASYYSLRSHISLESESLYDTAHSDIISSEEEYTSDIESKQTEIIPLDKTCSEDSGSERSSISSVFTQDTQDTQNAGDSTDSRYDIALVEKNECSVAKGIYSAHESGAKQDRNSPSECSVGQDDNKPTVTKIIVNSPKVKFTVVIRSLDPFSEDKTIRLQCPEPVMLEDLFKEVQTNTGLKEEEYKLEYCINKTRNVSIKTQRDLNNYFALPIGDKGDLIAQPNSSTWIAFKLSLLDDKLL